MNNLINSPEYRSVRAVMKAELEKLKVKTGYFDPLVYK